jgi:hypothetical protein
MAQTLANENDRSAYNMKGSRCVRKCDLRH